ncbi:MAG: ABC transporter permease [Deltaproteobacteria bacterium]|nr:ABC transporter permease [Deltaproteobacteria bacterium]
MLEHLRQMLIKEFLQTLRDPRGRFVLFAPLILQMLIFGYAATFELHRVPMAVLDLDHSYESRDLVSRFSSSRHFELSAAPRDRHQLAHLINHGTVSIAIQIPPGFAEATRKGSGVVQVIADGSDSNTAMIALGYVAQIAEGYSTAYTQEHFLRIAPELWQRMPSVTFERRPWYNEDLNSRWFFVPGVIGDLLTISVLSLAAFGIVRERELGTLEQLMVSPITRFEFILGKTAAPFLIGLCQFAVVMIVARLWFEVPFRGSYGVMLLGTCLYILSILGVAILMSTISNNQQQALMGTFFFGMPTIFLSGFAFPISGMPATLRWFSYLIPLRYFLVIIRASFLKGVGISVLWPQLLALVATSLVLLTVSTLRFHKSLD